ncbi:Piso0_003039 [Lichtheimia corymbifera JMRC:FSU:9682]|uniref:Piso0_003039 n=1 Tax=Lichtheimia corymbifera JMRC:FSU:9682 TaxID=1263082 RepID=A0A068RP07_9FUNG|nr:Piso0_003039 [Lichtheimia corymbifera JMRC:FSU:9682]
MTLGGSTALFDYGLVTPNNSQEQDSDNDSLPTMTILTQQQQQHYHQHHHHHHHQPISETNSVDWLDTDSSEDEDYLPQSCHRCFPSPPRKAMSVDNDFDEEEEDVFYPSKATRRKRGRLPESPEQHQRRRMNMDDDQVISTSVQQERVRRVIDAAIDNGEDYVDLSHLGLTEVPDEITELKHVTVLRKDRIKNSSLKLFLYGNTLTQLPSYLFSLKNLSVLSLRHNQLTQLPHEIGLLQNLVELSVGNNQLPYLPAEILKLPKLTILCHSPNPFVHPTSPVDPRHVMSTIPSLVEITSRHLLSAPSSSSSSSDMDCQYLPYELQERLRSVTPMSRCYKCEKPFNKPSVELIVWQELFGTANIPLLFRFCSNRCHIANA